MTLPPKPPATAKRHLPAVGIIGLVLVAAAAGAVVYTQYIHPPSLVCQIVPVHRLYVMKAIIKEQGGFTVQGIYQLNSTASPNPPFSNSTGPRIASPNATQLPALPDTTEILGNVGDTITLYIHPVSTNETGPSPPAQQQPNLIGHGFTFDSTSFFTVSNSTIPTSTTIPFGQWYTVSLKLNDQGQTKYRCTQTCSAMHPNMNGNLVSGCGG